MSQRWNLTVYRLRDTVDGEAATFDNVIRDHENLASHEPADPGRFDFTSKLIVSTGEAKEPLWAGFFRNTFDDLSVPKVERVDGLLLVQIEVAAGTPIFAFTFGQGRHLLRPSAILQSHGLNVALNAMYSGTSESSQVRSVDSKTIAGNTFNTRRQSDRRTDFEAFSVDTARDFLRTIVGRPAKPDLWGTRMSGGHGLTANPVIEFDKLGTYCKTIFSTYSDGSPPDAFSWINKLKPVGEKALRDQIVAFVVNTFSNNDDLVIAVPELIEWDAVKHFKFSCIPDLEFADPEDVDLSDELDNLATPKKLSVDNMKKWKLEAYDDNDNLAHSWPLLRCISGQLVFDGETYIAAEGDYYLVEAGFLKELDDFVAEIKETGHPLPKAVHDPPEGEYNETAANSTPDYLLLDKKTVRLTSKTSPIEICDVLTEDGAFIHVKRKLGSSSLSHLFAQGTVSADLLLMSEEYREKTDAKIAEAEEDRAADTGDNSFKGRFPRFSGDPVVPRDHEIVYAVAAKWNGRSLVDALPFFSKVNLRRHKEDLTRMGYPVTFARIEATPRP